MVGAFIRMLCGNKSSYTEWAQQLCTAIGTSVSKQAVFKRMNAQWVEVAKHLATSALDSLMPDKGGKQAKLPFKRILIQDSTTVALPDCMRTIFPGNYSRGKHKAAAKINLVINALSGKSLLLRILPFTKNEQSLSSSILSVAKAGDLVLRDLGYNVGSVFKALNKAGIYYISRHRYGTNLYDPITGQPISLKKLLGRKQAIDKQVLYSKKKIPVRLVALRCDEQVASEKIRKEKRNRDKRLNHSEEYYTCMRYAIFITNTDPQSVTPKQIFELYACRWQIEIVFKSWKQSLKLEQLIPAEQMHTYRVEALLYLYLAYMATFDQKVKSVVMKMNVHKQGICISCINLYRLAVNHLLSFTESDVKDFLLQFGYYMKLDKRLKPNASQHLRNVIDSFG